MPRHANPVSREAHYWGLGRTLALTVLFRESLWPNQGLTKISCSCFSASTSVADFCDEYGAAVLMVIVQAMTAAVKARREK